MQQNLYGLYLSREGATIRMPVNPESYSIVTDNDNSDYNVLGVGPIMIPRTPKLQTASWNGLLPGKPNLGAVVTSGVFEPPKFYIDFMESAMADKAPVRFVANRYMEDGSPIFDTNMEVLVTRFKYEERGGETGDFYYEIALSEYREYSPKTVKFEQTDASRPVQASSEETRSVPKGQLAVGQAVLVNGDYFYSSQGAEPHSTFSGFRGKISRIVTDDQLRYLKASASYCFTGRTAGEIIQEIAGDFQLQTGELDDTGYAIPSLIMEEKTCLDIISTALQKTLLATGTLYTFFDDSGALALKEAGAMIAEGVVGTGSLLTDYQYKTDIDAKTYNSIKLARPNEETGHADIFQAIDSANIGRWGLLQLYQKVDTALNDAQVEAQVRAMLKYHNRRFRTLKVQALGLLGLRAGQMLMMDVPGLGDIDLRKLVLLDRVSHTFQNDLHTMEFEVQELGDI